MYSKLFQHDAIDRYTCKIMLLAISKIKTSFSHEVFQGCFYFILVNGALILHEIQIYIFILHFSYFFFRYINAFYKPPKYMHTMVNDYLKPGGKSSRNPFWQNGTEHELAHCQFNKYLYMDTI